MAETRYCCPECASKNITLAAWVQWDEKRACYIMNGDDAPITEQCWCNNCNAAYKWAEIVKTEEMTG